MFKNIASILLLSSISLAGISPSSALENAKNSITRIDYFCERNLVVPVTYINTENGASYAVLMYEGKLIPMSIAMSASGARYIALDEQDSYRWHTKGSQANLSYLEADHTAKEVMLLENCSSDIEEE